jgi:hypothetical protein
MSKMSKISKISKISKSSKQIQKAVKTEPKLLSLKPGVKPSVISNKSGSSSRNKTSLTAVEKATLAKLDVDNMRPDRTRRRKTKAETRMLEEEF